jgi:hypothetical protein
MVAAAPPKQHCDLRLHISLSIGSVALASSVFSSKQYSCIPPTPLHPTPCCTPPLPTVAHPPTQHRFHSKHEAAELHAAARAVSGGPVYVSDPPGSHDHGLLRKLVLPDGTLLRGQLPGRPTRDSLFADVARDGHSLLKVRGIAVGGVREVEEGGVGRGCMLQGCGLLTVASVA